MVDWLNTVIAVAGLLFAIIAIWQTRRANHASDKANHISREANKIARQAMQMQEDDGKVKLVVKPQMLCVIGDGEDKRVRPVVTVVNLSTFPVTIEKIWWKTADPKGRRFFWKNPQVAHPFDSLPARLDSHQSLTALGLPSTFNSVDDLLSITAAVACTECGESIEGMTPQWKEYCIQARLKGSIHWNEDASDSDKTDRKGGPTRH